MKKLLSLILAAALVIGLMPMSFAADIENGNGNEWMFSVGQHNVSEETLAAGNFNSEYGISKFNGTVSDAWGFVNIGGGAEYDPKSDHILYEYNLPEIKSIPQPDSSYAIAIELDPDTSGKFNPTITVITETTAPIYEVYLMEKPANSSISVDEGSVIGSKSKFPSFARSLDKSKRLGLIDAYGTGVLKTVSFPAVTVDAAKNYWLVLSPNGANEKREGRRATSGGVPYYRATLKLVSFTLTNKATSNSMFFNYDITTNALSKTAQTDYGTLLAATAGINDNDTMYVSWKSIYSSKISPAIDTTKTTGYQLYGRNACDSSLAFNENGMTSVIRLGQTNDASKVFNAVDWESKTYENTAISSRPVYAIRINIPTGGKYSVSILNRFTADTGAVKNALSWGPQANGAVKGTFDKGTLTKVHFVAANDITVVNNANLPFGHNKGVINNTSNLDSLIGANKALLGYYDSTNITTDINKPVITTLEKTIDVEAGEYYLVFDLDKECFEKQPKAWGRDHGEYFRYYQVFMLSGIQLTPVSETNVDEIQSSYDEIVNVNPGNATEKAPANTTSNVQILCGVDKSVLETKDVAAGTDITYTAPKKEGHTFLYWAQGIGDYKKIVSYEELLSVKAEKGPMWLTAVYADDSVTKTDVVFYNANGDEISRSQYNEGDAITLPAFPSMAGFETATGWTLDEDGETYTADDEVKASGKLMRFVAEYADDPSENFDITVVDGTADNATPVYGETVTVTATPRSGAKLFNYWQKDGEIVSFDLSYSFKAWKDTTVKAVYNDYLPVADTVRKIIMGTRLVGGETAAVAEFIGISDVIEKGILFGTDIDNATHKVSMKTDGDTFSVIDDVVGEAIGYAILANGNVIYSK